ncbi:MAG: hypothetical protein K2Q26_05815 [Bdellovibrionales bacterium]|nr:hypothetical protein [Bdellovibrionales bacterium]
MFGRIVFSFFVCFLNSPWASAAPTCFDIFKASPRASFLAPFREVRSELKPTEIPQHGMVIRAGSREGLQKVLAVLDVRDGTYPLIIDQSNNVVIDHRLPDIQAKLRRPFLGTHRGLYSQLLATFGSSAQVVFAGQIRVVGGRAINLIDQASTFHDVMKNHDANDTVQVERAFNELVESNQVRLDFAFSYLKSLGLVSESTEIINYQKRFGRSEDKSEGHVLAERAAVFEIRCRANPQCLSKFMRAERFVRQVVDRGGISYIMSRYEALKTVDMVTAWDILTLWPMLLKDGPLDVMALKDMLNVETTRGQIFQRFIEDSPTLLLIED